MDNGHSDKKGIRRMRRAQAIAEYSILIIIVVTAVWGVYVFTKRGIQAKIKRESDTIVGHALGLEWPQQTQTISGSTVHGVRTEEFGGNQQATTDNSNWSITYSAPVGAKVMKHKRASISVQDAATMPPQITYPKLEYKSWDDKGWEMCS
jgi:hypothetical protein